jgi:hypothetical protein
VVSRPDEPVPGGLGPEESDTPPGDLPDLPDVPGGEDLPDEDGLLAPDDE